MYSLVLPRLLCLQYLFLESIVIITLYKNSYATRFKGFPEWMSFMCLVHCKHFFI